jgi:hypothetical protein
MPKAKYILPKLNKSIKISGENELNRTRHLLIKIDSIPLSAYIVPGDNPETDPAKLQELWMSGIEIESVWGEPNVVNTYTDYAAALVDAIYDQVKSENIQETTNDHTTVYKGKYLIFSLGLGKPEQVRLIGPITDAQEKKFSHPRVFKEFVNVITPLSHFGVNECKTPQVLGIIEDIEALTSYAAPMTFSEFLYDYTSGLALEVAKATLNTLSGKKCSVS